MVVIVVLFTGLFRVCVVFFVCVVSLFFLTLRFATLFWTASLA